MPGRILIIEDEEKLRQLLTRISGLESYIVTEAGTLNAAGRLKENEEVDVILWDVKLPDGNGEV